MDLKRFVPPAPDLDEAEMQRLCAAIAGRRVCILTGAGCSTESGIPDYRGEGTAQRARNPIQFRKFLADERGRKRYWARSTLGWPHFRLAEPNPAHHSARRLELQGTLSGIITQNVDRLHLRAGSKTAVELHGALEEVICLECGALEHRDDLQARILGLNPDLRSHMEELAPDGDADLEENQRGRRVIEDFRVPSCRACLGILKPNVVFFGEGVPRSTVDAAFALYQSADALLIAGSSLAVFSGFRFVRRAQKDKKPIFVINLGATRADELAQIKITARVGDALGRMAELLGA